MGTREKKPGDILLESTNKLLALGALFDAAAEGASYVAEKRPFDYSEIIGFGQIISEIGKDLSRLSWPEQAA